MIVYLTSKASRLLVVKFGRTQKLYTSFQLCGKFALTLALFKGQLYSE